MKRWFAICRGGKFYNCQRESWWEHAGEGTQFQDRQTAGAAVLLAGLNRLEVSIELVQEELEETGPDPADWWK